MFKKSMSLIVHGLTVTQICVRSVRFAVLIKYYFFVLLFLCLILSVTVSCLFFPLSFFFFLLMYFVSLLFGAFILFFS